MRRYRDAKKEILRWRIRTAAHSFLCLLPIYRLYLKSLFIAKIQKLYKIARCLQENNTALQIA